MINIVIVQEGEEASDLNIESTDLFFCTLDAEVHDHAFTIGHLRPIQRSDVLSSITEQVKVRHIDCIHHGLPGQGRPRRIELRSGLIVVF